MRPTKPRVYKGYLIKWTNWKMHPEGIEYYGQWVGHNAKRGITVCSPHPGPVQHLLHPDRFLELTWQPHQVRVTLFSPKHTMNRMKDCALALLKEYIDLLEEAYETQTNQTRTDQTLQTGAPQDAG